MIKLRLESSSIVPASVPGTLFVAAMVLAAAATVVPAHDDDPIFFYSGDQAIPLTRSATELVVTMDAASVDQTRNALESNTNYQLQPVPWRPERTDITILHTADTGLDTRTNIHAVAGVISVRPVYRLATNDAVLLSTGNLALKLDASVSRSERNRLFTEFGVELVREIDGSRNVFTVRPIDDPEDDEVRRAMDMHVDPRVEFAHPDFILPYVTMEIPGANDEFIGEQWHLDNEGQVGGTPGADINVAGAWEITLGSGVIVGMIDDSVDVDHEDFADNYIGVGLNNFTGEQSRLAPIPEFFFDAHGTAVTGLIVAAANDIGVRGVAPAARFTTSKGLTSSSRLAAAFVFAQEQDVDAHNNSWGPFFPNFFPVDPVLADGIRTAFKDGRNGRGMVILFASGNDGVLLFPNFDVSTLPQVISVGATRADDVKSPRSNFGLSLDVMAPSNILDEDMPGMTTTDVTDGVYPGANGYNLGTGLDLFGSPDFSNPNYTRNFGGTSAACPVATGVAALILSANPDLTATQVRVIMEQTCDKVSPTDADYHGITERSLKYGHGRLNAGAAVQAAVDSTTNGNLAWPNRLVAAGVSARRIVWVRDDDLREIDEDGDGDIDGIFGDETVRTLVVESNCPFAWLPTDGVNYEVGERVTPGVFVIQNDENIFFNLDISTQTRFYGLYPANAIDHYGFGTSVDSEGNVEEVGTDQITAGAILPCVDKPSASIEVSPLSGRSPLVVSFKGNALPSDPSVPIVSTLWDFGDGVTSELSNTSHRYQVDDDATRRFFATFTVTDSRGETASRTVAVDVIGATASDEPIGQEEEIEIVVGIPGSIGSDVDRGMSPFAVVLSVLGLPSGVVTDVAWDLGDGGSADTLAVAHTYVNRSGLPQTFPLSVTIETVSDAGSVLRQTATRFITVDSEVVPVEEEGTIVTATPQGQQVPQTGLCGAGAGAAMVVMLSFGLLRRRLR